MKGLNLRERGTRRRETSFRRTVRRPRGDVGTAKREATSAKMVDTFLRDGAEKQVCIGAWDTAVQQKAALAKDMFDASQLIAEKTLREDIFPRFEENEKGKALARDRPELCSAGGI